jgi:hypothetical protein
MRSILVAILLALASLPRAPVLPTAGARGSAACQVLEQPSAGSAKVWDGRAADFEAFITSAPIERFEAIPVGVTHPRRAFFKAGGLAESVAWKVLPPSNRSGTWESYKSEIAAYELDKRLDLGMVPVAVEKRWKHERGAAILWLAPVCSWREVQFRPKPAKWVRQMVRMKMFDNLIGNNDRNLGNLLVDAEWNVFLIDHSRAFVTETKLPAAMSQVDPDLWARMLSLDEPALTAAIGTWTDRSERRAVLTRRDKMKAAIASLVLARGHDSVFVK